MSDFPPGFFDALPEYDGGSGATVIDNAMLLQRRKDWIKLNKLRWAVREEYNAAEGTKAPLPPEYLRKIIKDHGDLQDRKFTEHRRLYIGALPFAPLALLKLMENMPMPWEQAKYVDVVYHTSGALTIVRDTAKVVEPLFHAQWAATWLALRRRKRAAGLNFERLKEICFDGAALDFATNVMDQDPPPPVLLELDPVEDALVAGWFYDPSSAPQGFLFRRGGARFSLDIATMGTLLRLAFPLLPAGDGGRYLWHLPHFLTAKALDIAIPGGPKFNPPKVDAALEEGDDEEWTEFTDLGKVIVRHPITSELQVALPWLYSPRIRGARIGRFRRDQHRLATAALVDVVDSPDAPVFVVSPSYSALRAVKGAVPDEPFNDSDGFEVPDGFEAFAADVPLEPQPSSSLRQGIDLLFAPPPFDRFQGPLRRPVDMPMIASWYKQRPPRDLPVKVSRSYQHLLKGYVKREIEAEKRQRSLDAHPEKVEKKAHAAREGKRVVDQLSETKHFQVTRIEWLEAAMQLMRQGFVMLSLLLRLRNHNAIALDENFNVRAIKTLSTKERKKTRLGQSFHLMRELMKLTKHVVDAHVKYRIGVIDAYQLADAIHYVFTHVGRLTGLEKYKYKTNQQIRQAQDLKHLIYLRFNTGGVGKGPGAGFWFPAWRMWLLYLRGMAPLLRTYTSNLLARLFGGRKKKGEAKRLTKQRVESSFDIELKDSLRLALRNSLPDGVSYEDKLRRLEQHASEAFRCWRANRPWVTTGLPGGFVSLINAYVRKKSENYVRQTYYNRERIIKGDVVDKGLYMKNLGRITRLKLRDEEERQHRFHTEGPELTTEQAVAVYKMMARWFEARQFKPIDFPKTGLPNEKELLNLCLDRLRAQHNIANRLTQEQREEQKRIEDAYDAPQDALNKIRNDLSKKRIFKPVKIEFIDGYAQLSPVFTVDPQEKMVDAFLDSYLWYQATERRLFPSWVKPADGEPAPLLVYQLSQAINNAHHVWDVADGEATVLMQGSIEQFYDKVDWALMKSLLRLIMHPVLVDYLCARHDVKLEYKDMAYEHRIGLIRGYQFASFLAQFWGLVCDLILLGPDRAAQLAGPPTRLNPIGHFADPAHAQSHPTRAYLRYLDRIYILLRFDRSQIDDLVSRFFDADDSPTNLSVAGYKNKRCWPRDGRMRLFRQDVNLGRAVHWDFRSRLPPGMGALTWDTSFVSVYSEVNPNLLFDLAGFDVRLLPRSRHVGPLPDAENTWKLRDEATREITAVAFVQVSAEHVMRIQNKIRRCLLSIGNSPFHKIATKWNAVLMEIVPYYREAILGTEGLQEIFVRGETKVQTRVKMALNSKMPDRFPPVIFYTPPELGGIGMLSVGGSLIPAKDLRYSRLTETGTRVFMAGMTHADKDQLVPNVMRYYPSWQREFIDSGRAWSEYRLRYRDAKIENRRLTYDEVEDLLDQGIPRIRTLFSKDRRLHENDRGWRVRQEFMQYQYGRLLTKWWFHEDHDGRLCVPLDNYKESMIRALGGVEVILEHTLFAGTGFASWDSLFWDKKGAYEDAKKHDNTLTKAQRMGLTQVPNRRFALWWSPTLNRSSVYSGFLKTLDLMGVKMAGKLELVKVGYINLFAGHLWEKIHCSVVESVGALLGTAEYLSLLGAFEVRFSQIPPKKSYTEGLACPDIIIYATAAWSVAGPSLYTFDNDAVRETTRSYWLDIQLVWGDYDYHDVNLHARRCYESNVGVRRANFPHPYGLVIAFDLAYNSVSAYGYWIPNVKDLMRLLLPKIQKNDSALQTLRTRMRRELQLHASDPTEAHLSTQNFADNLFGNLSSWLVDHSMVYAPNSQATASGNRTAASKNGALLVLNPKTGRLYVSVIHKSALQGHKRRNKLGREKAAEEVASWLRSVDESERPHKIIVTRDTLFSTMHSTLLDFQNIGLSKSDLALPLKYIVYHPRVLDMVTTATTAKAMTMNVYDDWGMTLPPISCFLRLLLILRCHHVNLDRAREILQPDRHVVVQPHHFWPTYSIEEWQDVERQLQDVILADYARRHTISVNQLTRKEIMDILLGKVVSNEEIQQAEMKELEEKTKTTQLAAQNVKTLNRRGEEITVRSTKTFDIGVASSVSDWRKRAAESGRGVDKVYAAELPNHRQAQLSAETTLDLVLPRRVLLRFLRCADTQVSILGVLYGFPLADSPVYEVAALYMPPQQGKNDSVTMATALPRHPVLQQQKLEPIGIIRTQFGAAAEPLTTDLLCLARLIAENESFNPVPLFLVNVMTTAAEAHIAAVTVSESGLAWALERRTLKAAGAKPAEDEWTVQARVVATDKSDGFFLVPAEGSWNYYFKGASWPTDVRVTPEVPLDFYHPTHRPVHFMQLVREMGEDDAEDLDGVDDDGAVI